MKEMGLDKEVLILECLRDAEAPLGSWNLVDKLAQRGVSMSPATVGRLLNSLEHKGTVKKERNSGRVITEEGLRMLSSMRAGDHIRQHALRLEELITTTALDDYISVLEARKAIERETARLAAQRVTDRELEAMETLLREQEERHKTGATIAQSDIEFHRAIAHASGNNVLESLYLMLFSYGQQTTIFEHIRKQVNAVYMVSHLEILEALRLRDPDLAEARMAAHMESLIGDVRKFWDKFYGGRKPVNKK